MECWARRFWAVLWVAAGGFAGTGAAAADFGPWQVELRHGERLVGDLLGLDRSLRLRLAGTPDERPLDLATVARLWLPVPPPPAAGLTVTLANGDRLAVPAVALANGILELDIGALAAIRVPQAQVRQIQGASAGHEVVSGLGALADWGGGAPHWACVAGAFVAQSAPAVLVRRSVLSERVRIAVTVAAEPPPDLWLHLYVEAAGSRPGAGYALHLTGTEVSLERHRANGVVVPIGSGRLPPVAAAAAPLEIALGIDLPRGRFQLASAAGPVADWTDPEPAGGSGPDLMLSAGQPPLIVHQVTVVQFDAAAALGPELAAAPDVDRVVLANGDVVEGDIEAIAAAGWTLRRAVGGQRVRLDAATVRRARLRSPPDATSVPMPPIRVGLRSGSVVGLNAVRLTAAGFDLVSPLWGPAQVERSALTEIHFGGP